MAAAIHAVQMAAYAQEARWLGVTRFEPLERTVDDIRSGDEQFLVARDDAGRIVGAIGTTFDEATQTVCIDSLVVAPDCQRAGIGRRLSTAVIAASAGRDVVVSTGTRNLPALSLYASLGFAAIEKRIVGHQRIEITVLRRDAR